MKVYVDELPEKCADCPLSETGYVYDDKVRFCKLQPTKCMNWIALYDDKRDDCPLQSLSDYTKQVRKEVVQELKEKLKPKEIFHPEDEFTLDYDFYYKEDVDEILDQI